MSWINKHWQRTWIFGATKAAFASKPAPTLDHRRAQILCPLKIKCGSGLAREGVRPNNANQ
ncbi:hypothetical protein C1X65_04040 [Pseudomonas sp. FW305-70]|nr:hypothetical protein C1X65_04040 [Pseudomonas sp. FW305-70]